MVKVKNIDRLEIVSADLADAAELYQRNFGLELIAGEGPDDTIRLKIGGVEVRLVGGRRAAPILAETGEGLAALYLETDDVEAVTASLARSGYASGAIARERGRRILSIDPAATGQVVLYLFDRKTEN